jgi:hypothetical protein
MTLFHAVRNAKAIGYAHDEDGNIVNKRPFATEEFDKSIAESNEMVNRRANHKMAFAKNRPAGREFTEKVSALGGQWVE